MTDDDRDWFADQMEGLGLTFDKEVSAPLCEIYFRALGEFDRSEIQRAVDQSVTTLTFFPKPAELIRLIEGTPEEASQGAWVSLENARAKIGYWQSLWIEDPALSQSLLDTFGGWLAFCDSMHVVCDSETGRQIAGLSPEMQRAKQKEFAVNYARAKKNPRNVSRYHAGRCESENRNAVGGWKRGMFPDGSFYQPVGILTGDSVQSVSLPFDALTGQLTEGAKMELESNSVGLLAAVKDQKAIGTRPQRLIEAKTSQPQNLITREQFEAARVGAMERIAQPSMSDEQLEERRRLLQEQARKLLEDAAS